LCLAALAACGGSLSVLHAKGKPTGQGAAELTVKNSSGTGIHRLYIAKTDAVDQAKERGAAPGSGADAALWGDDQLGNAGIPEGQSFSSLHVEEGRYDVLVVDKDNREQLVKRLKLQSGGRYVLEIGDAWTMARE